MIRHTADGTEDQAHIKEVGHLIAEQQGEAAAAPGQTIHRSVRVGGVEAPLALLQKTHEIEEAGGMLLSDGSRRRTVGGVYFWLLRQATSTEQRNRIFPPMGSARPKSAPGTQQPQPSPKHEHPRPQPATSLTWP